MKFAALLAVFSFAAAAAAEPIVLTEETLDGAIASGEVRSASRRHLVARRPRSAVRGWRAG